MIKGIDYPDWITEEGLKTLKRQHLLEGETPNQMYERIADTLSSRYYEMLTKAKWSNKEERRNAEMKFHSDTLKYLKLGWLCPSTPVLSNVGTSRGFGISCFIERVPDSLDGIYKKAHEMAMLTKAGGGVGVTMDKIRGRGEVISTGGFSEGTIPFMKVYDSAIIAANQGNVRRGSASINLPVRHKDIEEFLKIRLPEGDVNRQCLNLNHCVSIDDFFMESVKEGDSKSRDIFAKILSSRMKTGQPYIMYYHNVHNQRPKDMVDRDLKINGTNICTEILNPHDFDHTVVCCISSVNLVKFFEWENDPEFLEFCYTFLDVNLEEFIQTAKHKPGFGAAIRFAEKSRAIGLGVLGWHTFLQENNIPFNSIAARAYINKIGTKIKEAGIFYNLKAGQTFGSPEWCTVNRNLTLQAIAPTTTNSLVSGGVSQGIEPIICNAWIQNSAKGTFIRKNETLKKLMETKYPEHNTQEFWTILMQDKKGSIQEFDFFTDEEKEVFLTAYEINQLELIRNANVWQSYVDQGISLNLFFPADVDQKWLAKCHLEAWEIGIKTLYYVRTESILSRNMNSNTFSDCVYCE